MKLLHNSKISQKIEDKLDNGADHNLSMGERLWSAAEGVGKVGDRLISTKGAEAIGLGILAVKGAVGAAAAVGGAKAVAAIGAGLNALGTLDGAALTGKGTYDVATAATKEEAQKGGTELGSGAMMLDASAATAKQAHQATYETGLTDVNPEEVSTARSMFENVKTTVRGIVQGAKTALGIEPELIMPTLIAQPKTISTEKVLEGIEQFQDGTLGSKTYKDILPDEHGIRPPDAETRFQTLSNMRRSMA